MEDILDAMVPHETGTTNPVDMPQQATLGRMVPEQELRAALAGEFPVPARAVADSNWVPAPVTGGRADTHGFYRAGATPDPTAVAWGQIHDTTPIADRKVYNAVEIARIVWAMRQIRENVAGIFDRKDWSEISDERADAHIQEIKEALRMYGAAGVEAREFTLAWSGE